MQNYLSKDRVFQSRPLHAQRLFECTILYSNL